MKSTRNQPRREWQLASRTGRRAWCAVLFLACLGLTLNSASAFDENAGVSNRDGKPSSNAGEPDQPPAQPVAVGDETVGTLPVLQGGAQLVLLRDLEILTPSFFIEGNYNDVRNSLLSVRGQAVAKVIPLDPATGRVRMIFPFRVQMMFDRTMVENCNLQFGMWVPEPVPYADPIGVWGQRAFGLVPHLSCVTLPVVEMSEVGAFDVAPLQVHAFSPIQPTDFAVTTTADLLVLRQTH